MTDNTLSQAEPVAELTRTQVALTAEAHKRIKVLSAITGRSMGEILSDLCERHLPAVPAPCSKQKP